MTPQTIDQLQAAPSVDLSKVEAFAEQMVGVLNSGALTLMISIGHRTRLFDVMADLPPSTSEQIAQAAKLNERYVREWLGAMVVGDVVQYDAANDTYFFPPEHAAVLTRAATPDNIAVSMQFIPLLATVEDQVLECFYKGGGVPYSAYHRFHEVMAEDSGQTVVAKLTDEILPLVPGLVEALQTGIDVLDVGCGRGYALIKMAQAFPRSQFIGYDLSEDAIASANTEAEKFGLANIYFEAKDVTTLDITARYDLITAFDAIHDQARPDLVLNNIAKALSAKGTFLMQDIRASSHVHKNREHPAGPLLYTISCMHCMTVSLSANGMGLGTVWGEEKAIQMLGEAGFTRVETKQLPHDPLNNYYIATKT